MLPFYKVSASPETISHLSSLLSPQETPRKKPNVSSFPLHHDLIITIPFPPNHPPFPNLPAQKLKHDPPQSPPTCQGKPPAKPQELKSEPYDASCPCDSHARLANDHRNLAFHFCALGGQMGRFIGRGEVGIGRDISGSLMEKKECRNTS